MALKVRVWRGKEQGAFTTYEVRREESQTVLDVVVYIQRHLEPSLSYRYACRVGMCGSCAMSVNGIARWTCRTHVSKVVTGNELEIAPLSQLPGDQGSRDGHARFLRQVGAGQESVQRLENAS